MQILSKELIFPEPSQASSEGLLAIGGDLSIERLQLAYNSGIFPWYSDDEPILWWSPDPRMVLFPEDLKVSKSMKQLLKKNTFEVTFNNAFNEVIEKCAIIKRDGQEDTWITNEMITAYKELHKSGIAVSVEVWQEGNLVGGLYGIDLKDKKVFCGESMFTTVSNASKYGFISLINRLKEQDYQLVDCQVHTDHLESLGAIEIDREVFLSYL